MTPDLSDTGRFLVTLTMRERALLSEALHRVEAQGYAAQPPVTDAEIEALRGKLRA